MSASSTPALKPRRRIETASIALVMLLPTPPFAGNDADHFLIRLRSCGGSCCGARWSQLAPQLLQSWVHSLMVCLLFKNCSFFSLPKIAPECKNTHKFKSDLA